MFENWSTSFWHCFRGLDNIPLVVVVEICIYSLVRTSFWRHCRGLDNILLVIVEEICIYSLVLTICNSYSSSNIRQTHLHLQIVKDKLPTSRPRVTMLPPPLGVATTPSLASQSCIAKLDPNYP